MPKTYAVTEIEIQRAISSAMKKFRVPDWLNHLEERGWAVVPSVITENETLQYQSDFWDWMEELSPEIDRDDPKTWNNKNWPPYMRGLMQHWNIGHSEFVWRARQEPSIISVFSRIWDTDDLLVSFDGACLTRPPFYNKKLEQQNWAHIDQGSKREGRQAVQGLLTLTDAGEGMGGLLVYENSHKLHKRFFKAFPEMVGTKDWIKLTVVQKEWYMKNGCRQVQPSAPKGSLILWDSRTVHWAAAPAKEDNRYRMAIYLCYVPRSFASDKDLKKKRQAFEDRRMTSHWPAQPRLFPIHPRTWGDDTIITRFPLQPTIQDVTPLVRRLSGY